MLSPLLWAKIARGLSAGRVQSVAVRLLVEREREVRVFVPEEYWEIFADTTAGKAELRLQVMKDRGKNFRPTCKEQTDDDLILMKQHAYVVSGHEDKPTKSRPDAPLITST